MYLEKWAYFLYLNFISSLMSVTFLFLKNFDTLTLYFIRIGRLIFLQKHSTDQHVARISNRALSITIFFHAQNENKLDITLFFVQT